MRMKYLKIRLVYPCVISTKVTVSLIKTSSQELGDANE